MGARCEICGEWMPCATKRKKPNHLGVTYACCECFGEHPPQVECNRENGEAADRRYHGGMFHRGEW